VNDRSAWAELKLAVKVKLVDAPPAKEPTTTGCTAVKVPLVPLVAIAPGETLFAAEVPKLRTLITAVTGAPVPTEEGKAVNESIARVAGI
jgi:hypothetical protein